MSSLLSSIFEPGGSRCLLVAADRAVLYHLQNGRVVDSFLFGADDSGREQFGRYLDTTERTPLYLLVDLVEEEYRQDTAPHVLGADRRSVLGRKFARLFRGTEYCHAQIQGRETEGRRDDRVLLTALTRPEVVASWAALARASKVPLAGIYSLPIASQALLKRLGARGPNVLLVSVQGVSGLRQTYFRDGYIKISRLAQTPRLGSGVFAAHIMSELEKLRRYLNSLALISKDGPLQVFILSSGRFLDELETRCRDSDAEKFTLVDVAELARRLGLRQSLEGPYADLIFASLLLETGPRNHYARPFETQYFSLHRMRHALHGGAALFLLGGLLWSGLNFVEAMSYKRDALDAQRRAAFLESRFEIARRDLAPTPVAPREMKAAVAVVETLERRRGTPVPMLRTLGETLATQPAVQLDSLEWVASRDPGVASDGVPKGVEVRFESDPEVPDSHYHIAVLEAHLSPFDGDFRGAIEAVDTLAGKLRAMPGVRQVDVLEYPLNTRPDVSVSGDTTLAEAPPARFAVRVVLGVRNVTERDRET